MKKVIAKKFSTLTNQTIAIERYETKKLNVPTLDKMVDECYADFLQIFAMCSVAMPLQNRKKELYKTRLAYDLSCKVIIYLQHSWMLYWQLQQWLTLLQPGFFDQWEFLLLLKKSVKTLIRYDKMYSIPILRHIYTIFREFLSWKLSVVKFIYACCGIGHSTGKVFLRIRKTPW